MDHSIPLDKKERKRKVLNVWGGVCVTQAFFSLHSSTVTFLWDTGGQEECVSFFFFFFFGLCQVLVAAPELLVAACGI